jgi:hypothetical protein
LGASQKNGKDQKDLLLLWLDQMLKKWTLLCWVRQSICDCEVFVSFFPSTHPDKMAMFVSEEKHNNK